VYNVEKIKESISPSAKIIAVVESKLLGETLSNNSIPENSQKSNPSDEISSKNSSNGSTRAAKNLDEIDIEKSVDNSDGNGYNYTQEQYENFVWARENDILSATENAHLRSLFADAVSGQSNPPISESGEYMIAIGDNVDNKIAYMKGKIDSPVITRILEIDEINETALSRKRSEIYATEWRGIQQTTQGIFRRYDSSDFGYKQRLHQGISTKNDGHNNQLGANRGTSSGAAQKAQGGVRSPFLKVVHTFKDITDRTRNVLKVSNSEYMIEGDARSKYQPSHSICNCFSPTSKRALKTQKAVFRKDKT